MPDITVYLDKEEYTTFLGLKPEEQKKLRSKFKEAIRAKGGN